MNNEAFSQLVRERVSTSTREWAREEVAADWKRRKNEDDDDSSDDGRRKRKRSKQQLSSMDEDDEEEKQMERIASKYRDRAKERREGTLKPDDDDEDRASEGDEEDDIEMALRQSLQRKQSVNKQKVAEPVTWKLPETKEEATEFILSNQIEAQSARGRELLSYWQSKLTQSIDNSSTGCSNAGRTIQQTILLFDMSFPDPRNRQRAWLVPTEQTFATGDNEDDAQATIKKASPIPQSMIQQVKESLQNYRIQLEKESTKQQTNVKDSGSEEEDDDEEDIFGAIGSDYKAILAVPSKAEEASTKDEAVLQKISIFETDTHGEAELMSLEQVPGTAPSETTKNNTRLIGFTPSSGNDFGEDFDNDFDGRADWDDDDMEEQAKIKKRPRKKKSGGVDSET